jgi:hypothetical protein
MIICCDSWMPTKFKCWCFTVTIGSFKNYETKVIYKSGSCKRWSFPPIVQWSLSWIWTIKVINNYFDQLTISMKESPPQKANSCSATQESPQLYGTNSGKFFSIATIAPLYHWDGGNYFLSLLKMRENLSFLKNLLLIVIYNLYSSFVKRIW